MDNKKIGFAVLSVGLLIVLGFFGQKYIANKGWFTGQLVTPLADEKDAFQITDLPVEETRKFPLEIIAMKPNTDDVAEVSQITVTFNKPMVPLGDFEESAKNLPITVEPTIDCNWRWLNRTNLACLLNESLPPSNAYNVTIKQGFKAFDETELQADFVTQFSTLAWKVVKRQIEWKDSDLPIVYFTFNQEMNLSSLQKDYQTNCGKVKVSEVSVKKAEELQIDPTRTYAVTYLKKIGDGKDCATVFPDSTLAAKGSLRSQAYQNAFQTYNAFTVSKVSCGYYNKATLQNGIFNLKDCPPDNNVTVELSAPMKAKQLIGNIKIDPFFGWVKGGNGSPEYYQQNSDEEYESIYLYGPMQGRSTHTVALGDLKDKFGRTISGSKQIKITTSDFPAQLNLLDDFGVLEKGDKINSAFKTVNIKKFKLQYFNSTSLNDLELWQRYSQNCDYYGQKKENLKEFEFKYKEFEPKQKLNTPVVSALDLKTLDPNFTHGFIYANALDPIQMEGLNSTTEYMQNFCDNAFLVVTDLGIMAKVGFYDSGVWIHSIKTGKPLKNIKVQLRGYKDVVSEGTTDQDGFVKLEGAVKWDPERSKFLSWESEDELFVTAQTTDDLSVLPFYKGTEGLEAYSFSNYETGSYIGGDKLYQQYNHIVTALPDRPLYQPSQAVKAKIYARHWEPRTFGLKPSQEIDISVTDPRGKEVYKTKVKLSDFGTASIEFNLESSASLGMYYIEGKIGRWDRTIGKFNVQEFTLPSFKVEVQPIKSRFLAGQLATFKTSALYHFGGGLAKTDGEYTVNFNEQRWTPSLPKWKSFNFDDPVALNLMGYEKERTLTYYVVEDGKMTTDKNGDVFNQVLLSPDLIRSFGTVTLEAKFKDDRGKTIAGRSTAKVFYSDFQLGLKKDQWAYEAGEKIHPEVVLVNPDENAVPNQSVTLKLVHRKYQTIRVRGSGNYFGYETRTTDQVIDQCKVTSKSSSASCSLTPKAAGSHYIVAEAKDSKKRLAQSSVHLYVTGKDYVGWYRENHDRIDIIPDKEEYKLGEEVALLVKNPYQEVDAIFTLERFGILKQFRKKLTQGAEIVKIPVDSKDYAPGFYLSVHLIQGRVSDKIEEGLDLGKPSFKMGLAKIKVINPDTVIKVEASTDKKEYEPGQEVSAEVMISSESGKRETELSVAVVDEKILQLAGDYASEFKLHDKFYDIPSLDVMTSQLLTYLIGRRHFGKKGAPEGGDGDGNDAKARKNFLPIAYWNPALKTDVSGKAKFKFNVPDNLTSWKILVVAVDKEHRFGFGEHAFKTNKKLMVEPALPSFLTEGDKFKARFSIFNRAKESGEVDAKLIAKGLENTESEAKQLNIAKDDKGIIEWLLQTPFGSKKAELTISAKLKSTSDTDAAIYPIPIRTFDSYETFATYGSTVDAKIKIPLKVTGDIHSDRGGVEILYSPSLISHLDDSIRYGLDYPYACWEQKLVKALMLNAYIQLENYISIDGVEKDPKIWRKELLAEMPNFQSPNGGMGFWKSDLRTQDPYLSVFTALAMVWLNQSKAPIPDAPSKLSFQYTKNILSGKEKFPQGYSAKSRATVLAMAAYVSELLGESVTSSINKLYQDKEQLTLLGKSFLWSAASKNSNTSEVAEALEKEIFSMSEQTSGKIQFQEKTDDGFSSLLYSETKTNCQILTSLLEQKKQSPFVEPLVSWIIGERKSNRWSNTQENIFCLKALENYASIYEKQIPSYNVSTKVAGGDLKKFDFRSFKDKPELQKMGFEKMKTTDSEIEIEKSGNGRLYYTARLKVAYKKMRQDPVNAGLQVKRSYLVKNQAGKWAPAVGNDIKIKRGDLVRIEIKVISPSTRHHVALEDALPAGLEPLNTQLAATAVSEEHSQEGDDWNDDNWWNYYFRGGFYHRELRLAGAQYFADYISAGEYKVVYTAQAIAVGEFNVIPAKAEQMYEPEVYGKTSPAKFIITE